jgi:formylglycine-generating enzyme required for sulfatase activity
MSARKVFLSHTSLMARLPAGRSFVEAARDGVLRAGLSVSDMQFFPADDRPPAAVCEEAVRGCGVYIGVFGHDYGSRVRERPEVSYTELEFLTALEEKNKGGMRVFVFLQCDEVRVPGQKKVDLDQKAFRQRVLDDYKLTARFFHDASSLELEVFHALHMMPNYRDDFTRELGERSAHLREERRGLLRAGASPEEIQAVELKLRDLKRQIREGPRLKEGDCLSNRYFLIEEVGSGGFATVWRALDEDTGLVVAVKVLHGQHGDSGERHERFWRGARAMQGLAHPNVVRILDSRPDMEDGGHHYFVMEYIAGGTFFKAVTGGNLTAEERIGVILDVSEALAEAHERGLLHRDVTPDNILLEDGTGQAKLTDFDLVRLADSTGGTRTGALGKFIYAAPECMESADKVDQRCDVYSLGMTAVFAFHGKKLPHAALRRWDRFLDELSCPGGIKAVLERATEFDRDRRFETMKEFRAALQEEVSQVKRADSSPVAVPHAHAVPREDLPAVREIVNSIGMRLVLIPAGKFLMGSPQSEGRDDERPQHEVEITRAFYLGVHQVTQAQWRAVMGSNPSYFCATGGGKDEVRGMDTDDFPVEYASWEDVADFLEKLSALKKEAEAGRKYRLPTEAEWEYSCRGGRREEAFHYGNSLSSTQANFDGNYPYGGADKGPYLERTCKVGSYPANAFGLHDMHGNVWEWCQDWYAKDYYASSPGRDPAGPSEGSYRVFRGGGWCNYGRSCRSAVRGGYAPGGRDGDVGFRVAAVPVEEQG